MDVRKYFLSSKRKSEDTAADEQKIAKRVRKNDEINLSSSSTQQNIRSSEATTNSSLGTVCDSSDGHDKKSSTTNINEGNSHNPQANESETHFVKLEKLPEIAQLWKPGDRVPFLALARTFSEIQKTRARLQQIDILKDYFLAVIMTSPNDVLPSILMATNQVQATTFYTNSKT
jgi:hypothetical protein